ncbi:MAG: ABC transporter permease [Saprospiraceae bacterium]|nr:ABC transporter permease [Saprospiraceae bacterium]
MINNYFKIAWRNVLKNKTIVGINVAGLALSLACCILIFSVVSYHLSFDNFHNNSDRIYRIVTEMHRDNIAYNPNVPSPLGKRLREDFNYGEQVSCIATFKEEVFVVRGPSENKKFKEEEGLSFTEPNYFEIFNFPLLKGNIKTALIEPNTAIITQNAAQKYFGQEDAIGKTLWLNNNIALTITGILENLPENTYRKTEIYASYSTFKQYDEWLAGEDSWGGIASGVESYILLRPNVDPAQVEKSMQPYVKKFRPNSSNVHHYKLQPLADIHFNADYHGAMERKYLWILSIIGLFLIATACVNFINLATAQSLKRSKEVGLRKVMGSMKNQIFWQFLSETTLVVGVSIFIGLALSYLFMPFVNDFFQSKMSLNLFSDYRLPLFLLILGLVVILFSGFYPGLILAGFQPVAALKGKLSQQNIGGLNTRRTLIITQFAISQVLIIGIMVVMGQMKLTKKADLGFSKDAIVMVETGAEGKALTLKTLKNQFKQIPGVEKVSICHEAPATIDIWNNSVKFDNSSEEVNFGTNMKAADEDYLSTFDLELVAGKNLHASDTVSEFMVNEAFTRKLNLKTPDDAIGKILSADGGSMVGPIVGIVKDFHERSFRDEIGAVAFMTSNDNYGNFAIKINMNDAKSTIENIEKVWNAQYPNEVFEYQFLDKNIAEFYHTEAMMLTLIQFFAFIALFVGCLGLFGLVSFMVVQKTKEIGIRKVLGSSLSDILLIFGKEFSFLIFIAFFIASPIGWYFMKLWLQDFEYRIEISPFYFLYTVGFTLTIALLTVSYQAIKAAVMNPVKALKTE